MFENLEIPKEARPVLIFRAKTIAFAYVFCDAGRLPLATTLETWHERHITRYKCVGSNKGIDTLANTGPGEGSVIQAPRKYGVTGDIRRLVAVENEKALSAFLTWPEP